MRLESKTSIALACASAFACGAAAGGVLAAKYLMSKEPARSSLRLAMSMNGQLSPSASVASMSLPPTPRLLSPTESLRDRTFNRTMSAPAASHQSNEKYKMAIVIRKDLKWTVQTVTVMCATACLALFKKAYKARDPWLSIWVSRGAREGDE